MRPAVLASKAWNLAGLLLLTVLLASTAPADEKLAGTGSVAEWRTKLGHSELATAAYAAGVMAMGNIFSECKSPRTVRELHTYLLYRAPSMLSMKEAIWSFLREGHCTVVGDNGPMPSTAMLWGTKATLYSEEP